MNRTDRLLAIVLELQRGGTRRAEDLAETFETSKRTIYRDVQALSEAGVPVIATPGRGYGLMEGYFLPPLRFSNGEAGMLLMGCDFVAQNFDAPFRAEAASAVRKIAAVLPASQQAEVAFLRDSLRFIAPVALQNPQVGSMLPLLRRAIAERRRVGFQYSTRFPESDRPVKNRREADPYTLINQAGVWYVIGHCHLRGGVRYFRLDRAEDLLLLPQSFTRPAEFELRRPSSEGSRPHRVMVLLEHSVARWAQESRPFGTVAEDWEPEGLRITIAVRQIEEVVPWLLSWGARVQVIEPESLRKRLVEEAEGMLARYRPATVVVAEVTNRLEPGAPAIR